MKFTINELPVGTFEAVLEEVNTGRSKQKNTLYYELVFKFEDEEGAPNTIKKTYWATENTISMVGRDLRKLVTAFNGGEPPVKGTPIVFMESDLSPNDDPDEFIVVDRDFVGNGICITTYVKTENDFEKLEIQSYTPLVSEYDADETFESGI